MSRPLTTIEVELLEDVFFMGAKWMIRQPNGDLIAFRTRPRRLEPSDKKSPWQPEYQHSIPLRNKEILVSKEKEDFPRVYKTAPQPTSVLDLIAKHQLDYLWADHPTVVKKERKSLHKQHH